MPLIGMRVYVGLRIRACLCSQLYIPTTWFRRVGGGGAVSIRIEDPIVACRFLKTVMSPVPVAYSCRMSLILKANVFARKNKSCVHLGKYATLST